MCDLAREVCFGSLGRNDTVTEYVQAVQKNCSTFD